MLNELTPNDTFCDYYRQWVSMYKEGTFRFVYLSAGMSAGRVFAE